MMEPKIKKLTVIRLKPLVGEGCGPDDFIDFEKEMNPQVEEETFTIEGGYFQVEDV